MKKDSPKKRIPVEKNLFTLPGSPTEESHLLGSQCRTCGEVYFPKQDICANCFKENMKEIPLGKKGKLFTYTVVRQKPPVYEGPVPYALGKIELPEKVVVPALLTGVDFDKLEVGMDMEMVIEKLKEDEEGNDIIAFKFKPA